MPLGGFELREAVGRAIDPVIVAASPSPFLAPISWAASTVDER